MYTFTHINIDIYIYMCNIYFLFYIKNNISRASGPGLMRPSLDRDTQGRRQGRHPPTEWIVGKCDKPFRIALPSRTGPLRDRRCRLVDRAAPGSTSPAADIRPRNFSFANRTSCWCSCLYSCLCVLSPCIVTFDFVFIFYLAL